MTATKTSLMLFTAMTLSAGTIGAMDKQFYKMTIENQLRTKMFLNVPNPKTLTDQSPYPYIKAQKTKEFFLSQEEITNQSIAFPAGWPSDKVQLPIDKKETHFIIKDNGSKIVVEDNSKNTISELFIVNTAGLKQEVK